MSLGERLRSAYFAFWLDVSERLGHVRGPRPEAPGSLEDPPLEAALAARIEALRRRFGVRFECSLGRETALQNYARLELLERAAGALGTALPQGRDVHDVGCASFWYAAALHAAFRPRSLRGFEVEGYRRLQGGINRAERALGYAAQLPATEFVIADYATVRERAGLVTAFFPFVTRPPVLAWRLPLRVLAPQALFARVRANLAPDGELWMVNHGEAEAETAALSAVSAGLRCRGFYVEPDPLVARPEPAVVSRWSPGDVEVR